jgi:hypothetical protein
VCVYIYIYTFINVLKLEENTLVVHCEAEHTNMFLEAEHTNILPFKVIENKHSNAYFHRF